MNYTKSEDFRYHNKVFNTYVDENNIKYLAKSVDASQFELLAKINEISNNCESLLEIEAFFKSDENLIYLTKILDYNTLEEVITKQVQFTREEICLIIYKVVYAIDSLHQHNILHRDIKPANILINEDFDIKVIDFDISREYDDSKFKDTTLFGTRGYAAPEQYGFSQTSFQSDIYAFGKTVEILISNCYDTFDLQFEEIVKKATMIDPLMRFEKIIDIIEFLNNFDYDRQLQILKGIDLGLNKTQIAMYATSSLDNKQMGVIKHAIHEGVNEEIIKFMVNSNLESRQIWQIKQGALDNLDLDQIKFYAKGYYDPHEMGIIRGILTLYNDYDLALEYLKFYVNEVVNSKLSNSQINLIRKFIYHGYPIKDLKVVNHPHLSCEQMVQISEILKEK